MRYWHGVLLLLVLLIASCSKCPNSHDTCCGDPCCGDPSCGGQGCVDACCGDPCCGDPCCGDPCCGDPCCGDACCGGCSGDSFQLKSRHFVSMENRAAWNLVCPGGQVALESLPDEHVRATGCGKTATYHCACLGRDQHACPARTCRAEGAVVADPSASTRHSHEGSNQPRRDGRTR